MASEESLQLNDSQGCQLYLMRHGDAVPRGAPDFPDDGKRPLTDDGRKKMRAIAKGLLRAGVCIDAVLTSPLVRAAETADIVAKALGAVPLEVFNDLRPGGSLQSVLTYAGKHGERRRILVVGHEPDLGEAASRLIGAGRHANLRFKKGGCCRIDFDDLPPHPPGRLVWWLTPWIMKKMG
jgi:phosphohistidine phosphatase